VPVHEFRLSSPVAARDLQAGGVAATPEAIDHSFTGAGKHGITDHAFVYALAIAHAIGIIRDCLRQGLGALRVAQPVASRWLYLP